jgi:hypothetical protein
MAWINMVASGAAELSMEFVGRRHHWAIQSSRSGVIGHGSVTEKSKCVELKFVKLLAFQKLHGRRAKNRSY